MLLNFVFFSDSLAFEKQEVINLLVKLTKSLEILSIFNLMTCHLISMLSRCDRLVLSLSLLPYLCLQELRIVIFMIEWVLIWREIIFISRDSFENIFLIAASLSSLISDSESLSSR